MSRQYLNDRWCVKCGKKSPTPFLMEMWQKHGYLFNNAATVVDVGCGNGRNSKFFWNKCNTVESLDMVGDYGKEFMLGKDPFPLNKYDIVLANYIFMFLNERERLQVYRQIQKNTEKGSVIVIEMYPAKDSYPYDWDDLVNWFIKKGWGKIVKRKDKCLLEKLK